MKIRISGGRVIDPANSTDEVRDVFVADGRIVSAADAQAGFTADQVIDASGQWVIPGIVDLATHLREPGQEHKATIATETRAAAAAGITTLCCAPDTNPIIDTPAVAELIQNRAEQAGYAHVLPLAALTQGLQGEQISEMSALKQAGCPAVYNVWPLANTQVQRRAMEYAHTHDLTVFINPRDYWLGQNGCAHEGKVATRLGLPGLPVAAETAAVARDLALIELIGVRAHFTRLSTHRAVRMIARARFDGLPVSADVCAHQLHLTEMDTSDYDSHCHVMPPLRTERDRDGLREGVLQGVIQAICSDHQPHEADAKLAPFCSTQPGISALETLLPLSLRLQDEVGMPLMEVIRRMTSGPAQIIGIEAGSLTPGFSADLCIVDPQRVWQLNEQTILSQGLNSPFIGWEFTGRVTHTLFRGKTVYQLD